DRGAVRARSECARRRRSGCWSAYRQLLGWGGAFDSGTFPRAVNKGCRRSRPPAQFKPICRHKEDDVKLYYSPGACSLAPHIVAREAGLAIDLVKVDLKAHRLESGEDYYAINPRGYVPLLELDDGTRLTEVAVLTQFLADRAPQAGLIPP